MRKRFLSLMLVCIMVLGMLPVNAFAASDVVEVANKAALDDAIANVEDGDTIKLTDDIDYGTDHLEITKAITLDLGGKTLTTEARNYGLALKNDGIVVTNGKLEHAGTVAAIKVWNAAGISGLEIDVTGTSASGNTIDGIVIQENAAGVDLIENVKIYSTAGQGVDSGIKTYNCGNAIAPVIGAMNNVEVDAKTVGANIYAPCGTATNCTFKGGVSGIEIWIKGTYSASLDLVDCDVEGSVQAVYVHDEFNSNPNTVNSGTITLTADVKTTFDGGLKLTIARIEDDQLVLPDQLGGLVAQVGNAYYGTLAEAVVEANKVNGTVTLLADVEIAEKLTISGDVTISGEHTITRADAYTGTLFEVAAGVELTLDGGLTIDGNNEWVFDKEGYEAALADNSKYQDFAFVTAEDGAPIATADLFTLNGAMVVNEATIQNHMGNANYNVFGANANSRLTLNDGAVIKHNATPFESTVIAMSAGSTFTINEGAEISGNYAGRNGGVSRNNNGTIVMNGGEIINNYSVNTNGTVFMLYGADSKFEMKEGLICGNTGTNGPNNGRNAAIYGHTGSKMVMNGGSICHNTGTSYGGVDAPYTGEADNASAFEIKGGYIGENISGIGNPTADVNGGSRLAITGGTFTQDVTKYCADGYAPVNNGDGTWTVQVDPEEAVCEMDGEYFLTIKDALWTLKSADPTVHKVKVLKDHEIDVNYSTYNYPILVNGFAIELDLNGKTITADWSKYTGSRADNALIGVANGGKLTVIDSSEEQTGTIINNDDKDNVENRIFWIMTSTATKSIEVVIKGGNFIQNETNTALLYVQGNKPSDNLAPMYVTIEGGYFATVNDDFFNAYDGYEHESYITGGTFNNDPSDWEIKFHEGYIAVMDTVTDLWTIQLDSTKTFVAKIGNDHYETIAEAVEAANTAETATIELLTDVEVGEKLEITGDVTIEGAFTITWADGYTGTLFNIAEVASLTMKDVTIDGENAFTFYNDTTTVENGQNWYTRFVNVGEEDKAVNADVFVNAGNLTLGEGTKIQNVTIASDSVNGKTENTAEGGYVLKYNDNLAIIKSKGGTVTLNDAEIIGNAGQMLNVINTETTIDGSKVNDNMGCGRNGGVIEVSGGTMSITDTEINGNKAMARSATILGVINGAEVTFNATMNNNKHIGVGDNTAGAMVVLEGASQFVMEGGSISDNIGGRAGAIASRWVGGTHGQHEETSIVLNAGEIKGNTASNDSWNGASVFLRSPATIGNDMKIDGIIAVNAAPGALEITGGEFNGSLIVTDGLNAEITGGTFNYDPAEWVADGYTELFIGNGKWTVGAVDASVTVRFDANGGTSVAAQTITFAHAITNIPETKLEGYEFLGWYLNGEKFDFSTLLHEDITLIARWSRTPDPAYTIRNEVDGASLSARTAEEGEKVYFTDLDGVEIEEIIVTDRHGDEVEIREDKNGYYFKMPACTVTVSLIGAEVEPTFIDVDEDDYFFDAVEWAVEEGITNGMTWNTFDPNGICNRAQVVTFLWRAAGCPEPKTAEMPFTDVPAGAYFYDAVLWAVENGITNGMTETTFAPDATVTRGQAVTFLWRAEGEDEADEENIFTDVEEGAYYADAVLWAVENDITNGTSKTTFSPMSGCTRGQIVTFLYRTFAE